MASSTSQGRVNLRSLYDIHGAPFHTLFAICVLLWWGVHIIYPLINRIVLLFSLRSSFSILGASPFSDVCFVNIFAQSLTSVFIFLTVGIVFLKSPDQFSSRISHILV